MSAAAAPLMLIALAGVALLSLTRKKAPPAGGEPKPPDPAPEPGGDDVPPFTGGVEDCLDADLPEPMRSSVEALLASSAVGDAAIKALELAADAASGGGHDVAAGCLRAKAERLRRSGTPGNAGGGGGLKLPDFSDLPIIIPNPLATPTDLIPSYLLGSTKKPPFTIPPGEKGEHGVLVFRPGDSVGKLVDYYTRQPGMSPFEADLAVTAGLKLWNTYNRPVSQGGLFEPVAGAPAILPRQWQPYARPLPAPGSAVPTNPPVYPQLPSSPPVFGIDFGLGVDF